MKDTPTSIMANACVRVDYVFWIPGQQVRPSHEFELFLDDHPDVAEDLLGINPDEFDGDYEGFVSFVIEKGKCGFIVQATTMRPYDIDPAGDYALDWTHIAERFFYFEEFEQGVIANALADWETDVFNAAMVRQRLISNQEKGTSNE